MEEQVQSGVGPAPARPIVDGALATTDSMSSAVRRVYRLDYRVGVYNRDPASSTLSFICHCGRVEIGSLAQPPEQPMIRSGTPSRMHHLHGATRKDSRPKGARPTPSNPRARRRRSSDPPIIRGARPAGQPPDTVCWGSSIMLVTAGRSSTVPPNRSVGPGDRRIVVTGSPHLGRVSATTRSPRPCVLGRHSTLPRRMAKRWDRGSRRRRSRRGQIDARKPGGGSHDHSVAPRRAVFSRVRNVAHSEACVPPSNSPSSTWSPAAPAMPLVGQRGSKAVLRQPRIAANRSSRSAPRRVLRMASAVATACSRSTARGLATHPAQYGRH